MIEKIQLLHPQGKKAPSISQKTYELFKNAIIATLEEQQPLTYTDITAGVRDEFFKQVIIFDGSVSWYSVCVKNHLESIGVIETFMQKGKKMHRLKTSS